MEIRYYKCEKCGKEGKNLSAFYTISRHWSQACYDMGEYEGTVSKEDVHHICTECWDKIKGAVIN